jgi:hypothetical protein
LSFYESFIVKCWNINIKNAIILSIMMLSVIMLYDE